MATAPKFRIDVDIHNLLMGSSREPVRPATVKELTLQIEFLEGTIDHRLHQGECL